MKILVVCQYYWPEPYRLADICEELAARGHQVDVVTDIPNYPEGYIYEEYRGGKNRCQQRNGVRITRTFTIGRRGNAVFRLLNYYSYSISSTLHVLGMKEQYDVVLAYQASPVMMSNAALVYGRKHGVPVLLYCMDLWPASLCVGGVKENSLLYRYFRRVSRRIYRGADSIAVSSRGFSTYMIREFGIDPRRMFYLPQYADNSFPVGQPPEKSTLDLVFAGNVGTAQSIPTILEAAKILEAYSDIRWHIIGTGSALEDSRKIAGQMGLDCVEFHGFLAGTELQRYYKLADAMLITLTGDVNISLTLPMKIMSYMASGKAILASAGGEIAAVMAEASCGYCVPAESPAELAKAVLRFREDPDREGYGARGKAYYEEHFPRKRFMDQLEAQLCALGGGGNSN